MLTQKLAALQFELRQLALYLQTRPSLLKLSAHVGNLSPTNRVSQRSDLYHREFISTWAKFLRCQKNEKSIIQVDTTCCAPADLVSIRHWYTTRLSHRTRNWGPQRIGRSREYTGEMIWEATWALRQLQPKPGLKILDVGAENSFMPIYLASHGAEVWVVDKWLGSYGEEFEANVLQRCINNTFSLNVKGNGHVHYQNQDATQLNFPDNHFDYVLCVSVIEHIIEDSLALQAMSRVLKPGGRLILTTPVGPHFQQGSTVPHHKDANGKWTGDLDRIYSADTIATRLVAPSGLKFVGPHDYAFSQPELTPYQMPGGSSNFASAALFLEKPLN
jgi:ubiquinone/menaquinone biosynthesis C-methylase UbiE